MNLPLHNILVLEFTHTLTGPYAGLRLSDLGARVLKIERPNVGDPCRKADARDRCADGDSLVFHAFNRNKESYTADFERPADRARVRELISRADVLIHDLRLGILEESGFDYERVRRLNPRLIYAETTGYGREGPWQNKPAQDLLVQSVSGLTWLTGDAHQPPVPVGVAAGEMLSGTHLALGILAALIGRARTGLGSRVEVSLLESLLDFQFEVLTTHFNDGHQPPRRARYRNAHAYLGAPYGIYETQDGYIAIAMGSLTELGRLIDCQRLDEFDVTPSDRFDKRNEIKQRLAQHFKTRPTREWLDILEPADFWCSDVLNHAQLVQCEAYQQLGMEQTVRRPGGGSIRTLRCPIRIDGQCLHSDVAAPALGNANERVNQALLERSLGPRFSAADHTHNSSRTLESQTQPLNGILVVDFSQFLSGPSASLRLADLGARVIKVERPGTGDICRQLYVSNTQLDGESTVFHAINRNKEGFCADVKQPADLEQIKRLLSRADVVIHNFRPGVMKRLGLDYNACRAIRPDLIYGAISGYGNAGPWRDKPGQDLLVQALSGLTWLSGNAGDGPVPMGLAIVDIFAGAQLAQGILAALVRRTATGQGGLVEINMLESILDFQLQSLTIHLQDEGEGSVGTATSHTATHLGTPAGIYETADGYLALGTGPISLLGELLGCPELSTHSDWTGGSEQRNPLKAILARRLRTQPTEHWMTVLGSANIACAEVLDWPRLMRQEAYKVLGFEQTVCRGDGFTYQTTRCPIRLNGERLYAKRGSPDIGEHNQEILGGLAT